MALQAGIDLGALDLSKLTRLEKEQLIKGLEEKSRREARRKFAKMYPDEGPLRRDLYPKHMEFFAAGAIYRERCFMAGNRVGKTEGGGGYELTCHLTGRYPKWWKGRRFKRAISAWMSGKSLETTRDILQKKMLGRVGGSGSNKYIDGTGLIPGDLIGKPTWKQGIPDLVDIIQVRHITGDWSILGLKSYEQGRDSFEGTEQDVIWLDEEPPLDVYNECLIRTATTNGLVMLTFTPLEGMSEVVKSFRPAADINAEW